MIDYISGEVADLTPAVVVVDCNGLGYAINISLNTYSALAHVTRAKVYIYEAIREDAYVLYGFLERDERELFLQLISVSGVGPNTGRVILSSLSVEEIKQAILSENLALLKGVKGIGAKTAQRIIIDLKDKITGGSGNEISSVMQGAVRNQAIQEEAVAALLMLGFPQAASHKVVQKLIHDDPQLKVEEVIKKALKLL